MLDDIAQNHGKGSLEVTINRADGTVENFTVEAFLASDPAVITEDMT